MTKKILTTFVFVGVLAGMFVFPELAAAQPLVDPGAGADGNLVPCSGSDCQFCHFVELGSRILNWLFGLVFVIFGVILFVAGFGLVTSGGNQSRLDDAKNKLSNAIIGLLIIFAAWLIVDTMLKATLGGVGDVQLGDQNFGPWYTISCDAAQNAIGGDDGVIRDSDGDEIELSCVDLGDGTERCVFQTDEPIDDEGVVCFPTDGDPAFDCVVTRDIGVPPDETEARDLIDTVGNKVTVNKEACPVGVMYDEHPGGCTSVAGLNPALINAVGVMNLECGSVCNSDGSLVITGGTEAGHAGCRPAGIPSCSNPGSHSAGDKVDLGASSNPGIDTYMENDEYFRDGFQGSREARVNIATGVACVREVTVNKETGATIVHWDCQRPL